MSSFFQFFAGRHKFAMLLTVMIILLGLSTLMGIKREQFPEVDFGELFITTIYPGASSGDMELNVTNKIEDELKGVTGIDRITSVSTENLSSINVVVDTDVKDQEEVKREIRDAVNRVTDFPQEVTESPRIFDLKSSVFPVMEVGVSGELPYRELREVARLFEKKLESLPGVSSVNRYGYRAREIQVEVQSEAMERYRVPFHELIGAIQRRNVRGTMGNLESYTSEKNIVTLAQFTDPVEVGDVIVRSSIDGSVIRVKDLAIIRDDFEEETIYSRMNGKSAVSLEISKTEGADIIRTTDAIKELIKKEQAILPDGVDIFYSNDISRYVRNRFDIVRMNGIIGLVFVLLTLTFFLNLRTAVWVAMGIPVSLFGVIFLLPFFGVALDGILLASMILVLGIIVDDGIIISENIYRRWENGDPPLRAAVEGIREVYAPVITTILTTFLAFAPMFFMPGIMGKFIFVIPLVISLALFVSLIEATLALPAHILPGLRRRHERGNGNVDNRWVAGIRKGYARVIPSVLRWRYLFVTMSLLVLFGTLFYAGNFMKFTLFPSGMADQFYVMVELPRGSSLQATSDKVREVEALLDTLPERELLSYITRVGEQLVIGEGTAERENHAYLSVNLTPLSDRDRTADEIVESLRRQSDTLPGENRIVYTIESGGPPVGKPITIRVVGAEDGTRTQLADALVSYLAGTEGVRDISRDDVPGKDQIEVKLDNDALARLGLSVADVAQNVRIAYDGQVVTSVRYGDEDVDYRLLLQPEMRGKLTELSDLLIPNNRGELVPLKAATFFEVGPGPADYRHFDGERSITVTADVAPDALTPLEITNRTVAHFNLTRDWPGMRFVVGGEAQETQESMAGLFRTMIIALIGIYFLLVLLFNSWSQPFLVMMAIPFGIIGVVIAFALHGEPFSFVGMLGVIGLAGVAVNDSIVLVDHINQLRSERTEDSLMDIVVLGGVNRLRPVIMTTLTTIAGLMPLAYGIGGSDPYMAPMALALAYGLLFSTPLVLVLVPCLYLIFGDVGRLFRRVMRRETQNTEIVTSE